MGDGQGRAGPGRAAVGVENDAQAENMAAQVRAGLPGLVPLDDDSESRTARSLLMRPSSAELSPGGWGGVGRADWRPGRTMKRLSEKRVFSREDWKPGRRGERGRADEEQGGGVGAAGRHAGEGAGEARDGVDGQEKEKTRSSSLPAPPGTAHRSPIYPARPSLPARLSPAQLAGGWAGPGGRGHWPA